MAGSIVHEYLDQAIKDTQPLVEAGTMFSMPDAALEDDIPVRTESPDPHDIGQNDIAHAHNHNHIKSQRKAPIPIVSRKLKDKKKANLVASEKKPSVQDTEILKQSKSAEPKKENLPTVVKGNTSARRGSEPPKVAKEKSKDKTRPRAVTDAKKPVGHHSDSHQKADIIEPSNDKPQPTKEKTVKPDSKKGSIDSLNPNSVTTGNSAPKDKKPKFTGKKAPLKPGGYSTELNIPATKNRIKKVSADQIPKPVVVIEKLVTHETNLSGSPIAEGNIYVLNKSAVDEFKDAAPKDTNSIIYEENELALSSAMKKTGGFSDAKEPERRKGSIISKDENININLVEVDSVIKDKETENDDVMHTMIEHTIDQSPIQRIEDYPPNQQSADQIRYALESHANGGSSFVKELDLAAKGGILTQSQYHDDTQTPAPFEVLNASKISHQDKPPLREGNPGPSGLSVALSGRILSHAGSLPVQSKSANYATQRSASLLGVSNKRFFFP